MKSKFTVKMPSALYKGDIFIIAFFVILNVLYTIFGKPPHYPMYIATIILIFIPISISWSLMKRYKVKVNGNKITIYGAIRRKYRFDVSEIIQINWINNEQISVETISKHFVVENCMDGFQKFSEYLLKNVDSDKIIYIKKQN